MSEPVVEKNVYMMPEEIVKLNQGKEAVAYIGRVSGAVELPNIPISWILSVDDDAKKLYRIFTLKKQNDYIEPIIKEVFVGPTDLVALNKGEKADVWISEVEDAAVVSPIPLSWVVGQPENNRNFDRILIQKPEFQEREEG